MQIRKDKSFRTWSLGELPGSPQSKEAMKILDDNLINRPQVKAGKTGESFLEFSSRVLGGIKPLIESAPHNTAVLTHNSVFNLIKLWDKKGRPKNLDRPFRTEYTKMESNTGAHFKIKSKAGEIYICRHGETQDNLDGNFRSDDTDLTDKGRKEAKELGEELKKDGIADIIASPLPRTIETAEIIKGVIEGVSEGKDKEVKDEEGKEEETPKKESKGLCKSVFLYMEPRADDDKETFASCSACRMFLASIERCSLHGKGVKVDADDSCGLFVRGKAPKDEVDHMEASVTKEESGLVEGPVQCMNCHYFMKEKEHNDCLLFRLVGIEDYHVPDHACCNAFSPKHKPKEEKELEKDE